MLPQGPELEPAEWHRLLTTFAAAGVTHFSFTGGEAILKEGLADLIAFAAHLRPRPTLNLLSNGRALTDDWMRLCARHGVTLSISLPGLRTLPEHTGADTSPDTPLRRFARAKALGCATGAGVAVTRRNLPELYETLAAALIAGADTLLLNRFLPGGRGLSHPELELSPEEVVRAADIAEAVLTRAGRTGHFGTELPLCLIDPAHYKALRVTTGCSAARDFFVVCPDGWLRACNHSPVRLVPWEEHPALAQNADWLHFLRGDHLPAACHGCSAANHCRGGCREAARVTFGDPTAPDPIFRGRAIHPL